MSSIVKNIVVFGANCGKCKKAELVIKSVIEKYKLQADVTKCEDWNKMVQYNVTQLPTIMINNVIRFKGIVPSEKEMLNVLL